MQDENAQNNEKKPKKKLLIIIFVAIILIAFVSIIIAIILTRPKYEKANSVDEANEISYEILESGEENAYQKSYDYMDSQISQFSSESEKNDLRIMKLGLLFYSKNFDKLEEFKNEINEDNLTDEEKEVYYNTLAAIYAKKGDFQQSEYYYNEIIKLGNSEVDYEE